MKLLKKLFKKEPVITHEAKTLAYMGSLGISPEYMKTYLKSIHEIKKYENNRSEQNEEME
jgi:hypothetical protein